MALETPRSAVKSVAESLAVRAGAAVLGRWRVRSNVLILAYHNVVPDDVPSVGDPSLHLPLSRFRGQLDHLVAHFDVVPLAGLTCAGPADRPRVAITFDDAYRGALELGLPEITGRGLPATVFVAPGILGVDRLWWDRCAAHPRWGDALRHELLEAHAGAQGAIERWADAERFPEPALTRWHGVATEAELALGASRAGVTVGAHSWSHPNLARVRGAELEGEVRRPGAWLAASGLPSVPWFAYPYGSISDAAAAAVREAGYKFGLAVSGGWTGLPGPNPLRLPRWNVAAGLSPAGFELRLAGWLAG